MFLNFTVHFSLHARVARYFFNDLR
jgi:hypothetical protein